MSSLASEHPFLRELSSPAWSAPAWKRIQPFLDRIPRLWVSLLGRRLSSWVAWGLVGLAPAAIISLVLAIRSGGNPAFLLLLAAADGVVILLVRTLSRRLFGYARGVLLEHLIPILLVNCLILWLAGLPVSAYLDAWMVGATVFLMFGRIGCLLSGCCHGMPAAWGMRYPWLVWKSAPAGLNELRLLPVQAFESMLFALLLAGQLWLYFVPHHPGEVLFLFLAGYSAGRFGLEFLRGDERPYFLGFSEAQWTAAGLAAVISLAPWVLVSPAAGAGYYLAAGSLGIMLFLTLIGRRRLGMPPIPPLSYMRITGLERAIRRVDEMTAASLLNGRCLMARHQTAAYANLIVRLDAGILGDRFIRIACLSWRGRRLDPGSAAVAALVLGKVYQQSPPIRQQGENPAGTFFRIENQLPSEANHAARS
jgi:hypothetical protein